MSYLTVTGIKPEYLKCVQTLTERKAFRYDRHDILHC